MRGRIDHSRLHGRILTTPEGPLDQVVLRKTGVRTVYTVPLDDEDRESSFSECSGGGHVR